MRERLAHGDVHAPLSPGFVAALGARLGRRADGLDVVLAARANVPPLGALLAAGLAPSGAEALYFA